MTPAVLEWVGRVRPGARVARCTVHPLSGGAVPELVAWGDGWLITRLAPGSALSRDGAMPVNLVDTLARLHYRYQGGAELSPAIPRVTSAWWRSLCRDWVEPRLREHADRHPPETIARAHALVARATDLPAASALLGTLTPTLLHGDVHDGNVLSDDGQATLIDWGNSRIGPAPLDQIEQALAQLPTCKAGPSAP